MVTGIEKQINNDLINKLVDDVQNKIIMSMDLADFGLQDQRIDYMVKAGRALIELGIVQCALGAAVGSRSKDENIYDERIAALKQILLASVSERFDCVIAKEKKKRADEQA